MPVMAMGVAELKRELRESRGFSDYPEIHSFLDGFYLSRIGIRILIGQHIALHEPPRKLQAGRIPYISDADAWPMFCARHAVSAMWALQAASGQCWLPILVVQSKAPASTRPASSWLSLC